MNAKKNVDKEIRNGYVYIEIVEIFIRAFTQIVTNLKKLHKKLNKNGL
jgi:hypothetical protein